MAQHHAHSSDNPGILQHAIRAGELVQKLFYTFLENSWAYDVGSISIVRSEDGQLVRVDVTDGVGVTAGPEGQSTCDRYANGWLIRFPVKDGEPLDPDVKDALLADHNSMWAFVCMHMAVQILFEQLVNDVYEDIKEVVHYPAENIRRIVSYRGRSSLVSHRNDRLYPDRDARGNIKAVYDITLKDGKRMVLDPASAQWKFKDVPMPNQPVLLWAEYWQRWGGALKYRVPFRTHQARHAEQMRNYHVVTHHSVNMEQTFYFNDFLLRLKMNNPNGLECAFNMDAQDFTNFKASMVHQACECIQQEPEELDEEESPSSLSGTSNTYNSEEMVLEVFELPRSLPLNIGAITAFDWEQLRRIIQMPGKDVTYREKKRARTLLSYRCVYKMPGDWKLVFLEHTLPDLRVPKDCVSENPFWQ